MARYGVKTKLSPEQVIQKALAYFGKGGLGLDMTKQGNCCAYFEGGGGHVQVMAASEEKKTDVELETREWDYDVKQFMRQIGR
jgi:hypothetical protein